MILSSSELEETDPDWRRPTIHAHHDLTDSMGHIVEAIRRSNGLVPLSSSSTSAWRQIS